MQIIQRTGDFIAGDERLIIHGCNAQGQMGAGVAEQVREKIPVAYRAYREVYLLRGLRLGEVIWAIDMAGTRPRIVGNIISQEHYGRGDKLYVNYDAIRHAVRAVDQFVARTHDDIQIAGMTPIQMVGMPMIGSDLGGGDWGIIAGIIEQESVHFKPVVYRLR